MSATAACHVRGAIAQENSADGRQDARLAVEAFAATYVDAYNRKDAAAIAALDMEDGLRVPPGPISVGAEGNIVWSVGQYTVMAPDESGVSREGQGNFVNIYQWQGDGLKFRVHSFSFVPASPR
jgi:ketosteroid isomerase-like protein